MPLPPAVVGTASGSSPRPLIKVVLVTDIGRDIDDLIALLVCLSLHKQKKIKLCAVVGTGGAGFARACVSRWWLRRCGVPDSEIRVAADLSKGMEACYVPEAVMRCPHAGPTPKELASCEATVDREYDPDDKNTKADQRRQRPKATKRNAVIFALEHDAHGFDKGGDLILTAAKSFKKELQLTCIAPLSPVMKAMLGTDGKADATRVKALQGIGKLLIQGQAIETTDGLLHDKQAFNLRQDEVAAAFCFKHLQDAVPFSLLGKFAAYKVSLYRTDFAQFDQILAAGLPATRSAEQTQEMTLQSKRTLNVFRQGDPEMFYKLYSVSKAHQNDRDWFNDIKVCCHPYDPLMCLTLEHSDDFLPVINAGRHQLIGMTGKYHGVPSVPTVHKRLVGHLLFALQFIKKVMVARRGGASVSI